MEMKPSLEEHVQDFAIDDVDSCPSEKFTISEASYEKENAIVENVNTSRTL